jgi:hypothetical protein
MSINIGPRRAKAGPYLPYISPGVDRSHRVDAPAPGRLRQSYVDHHHRNTCTTLPPLATTWPQASAPPISQCSMRYC